MNAKTWKTFLNPGWIFTFLIIIAFTYLAFSVLAPWQLHKNTTVSERNHLVEDSFTKDPVAFDQVFNADGTLPADHEYQRVRITGSYLPDSEVVMRVRPVESGPAYHALTPFKLADDTIVLVNRGWMRPENGQLPGNFPAAPRDEVTLIGYARIDEPTPQIAPTQEKGRQMVTGIDTEEISGLIDLPLAKDYIQLAEDQPGVLNAFPLPKLDNGPHLSYGIQWIAFGVLAPLGLAYFVRAELRERRREQEEQAELATAPAGAGPKPQPDDTANATAASAPAAPPVQRSRYGTNKKHDSAWARDDEDRF